MFGKNKQTLIQWTGAGVLALVSLSLFALVLTTCTLEPDIDALHQEAIDASGIGYTVLANGSGGATPTPSTKLIFQFKKDVPTFAVSDITITDGTGSVTKGLLTKAGSDKDWELVISNIARGNIKVQVKKAGIQPSTKTVTIYDNNINYSVTANNPTTKLTLNFDDDVSALITNLGVILAADPGTVIKGTLSKINNKKYDLPISGFDSGAVVTVTILIGGIVPNEKTVTVTKTLSSIAITTPPTKTTYEVGDTLDLTGLVVTATYSDTSTAVVTPTSTSPAVTATLALSNTTVTVTYKEGTVTKTANFAITVNAVGPTLPTLITPVALSITAPVKGGTPYTTAISETGYTGTILWSPADDPFLASTVYTANVSLTAESGFTFDGLDADIFTNTPGGTVTHSAGTDDTLSVSVAFLATAPLSTDAELTAITIGGVVATLGTADDTIGNVTPGAVTLDVLSDVDFSVTKSDSGSTQKYQVSTSTPSDDSGMVITIGTITSLTDGDTIWIKSVAEDGSTTLYYAIEVTDGTL